MKLLIVRHGQTLDNVENICQGQSHGTLSELGVEQARQLAVELKERHIDACFSSDLRRAVQTAKIISPMDIILDKRLRERNFGSLQGQNLSDVLSISQLPDDVETLEQMWARVDSFIGELKRSAFNTVLMVSHGFTIKVIATYLMHETIDKIDQLPTVANCSITEFNI